MASNVSKKERFDVIFITISLLTQISHYSIPYLCSASSSNLFCLRFHKVKLIYTIETAVNISTSFKCMSTDIVTISVLSVNRWIA